MRVVTPEGVLVIFDAASPREGDDDCSGYLAYWLFKGDMTRFVFPGVLHEPADLATPLLALERDLGVDLEALADADERVGQALSQPAIAAIDDPVWEPATVHRTVEIMGFDPEDDPDLDEPGEDRTAQMCDPYDCFIAGVVPPDNCGSPSGLAREAQAVANGCCGGGGSGNGGGGGGSDPCPCCGSSDPCCGSSDPCCDSSNPCCGSSDPCCGSPDPCCGDLDCDGEPDSEDDDLDGDKVPNDEDEDVDGDGLLDQNDPDADGDGTPNGEDDDMDGDGIPNTDDDDDDGDDTPDPEDPCPSGCCGGCCGSTNPCCGSPDPCCGVTCGDYDPCTDDSCENGSCVYTPMICNDQSACTIDECIVGLCVYVPIDCNDWDSCTDDSCSDGACAHVPKDCDDDNSCTADTCVAISGECSNECMEDCATCGTSGRCVDCACESSCCEPSTATQTVSYTFPDWSMFKSFLESKAELAPMIQEMTLTLEGEVSAEMGETCCTDAQPRPASPVSYYDLNGTVTLGIDVTLNVPGWSWGVNYSRSGYGAISGKITLGPTLTLNPSASATASGRTVLDWDCPEECVTLSASAGLAIDGTFGGQGNLTVTAEPNWIWDGWNGGVEAEATAGVGTSATVTGYYKLSECAPGPTGWLGGQVCFGALQGTITLSFDIFGLGYEYSEEAQFTEEGCW